MVVIGTKALTLTVGEGELLEEEFGDAVWDEAGERVEELEVFGDAVWDEAGERVEELEVFGDAVWDEAGERAGSGLRIL